MRYSCNNKALWIDSNYPNSLISTMNMLFFTKRKCAKKTHSVYVGVHLFQKKIRSWSCIEMVKACGSEIFVKNSNYDSIFFFFLRLNKVG